MGKRSKRYKQASQAADSSQPCMLDEAVEILKSSATAKFDETIDLATHLGVDPRQSDQNLRGTISLPHGTGKQDFLYEFEDRSRRR